MKVLYSWLKELIPGLTASPQEVADILTLHSFETVIDHEFSLDPSIRIVEIVKIESHPGADRLRLATINDGKEEIRVVCGAPNIEVRQRVPYAPPGTKVLDKDGQQFELTVAKIRGVESPGMLNSKREIGLGDDHGGIFVLPADTPLGTQLVQFFPNETVLECDITPNRAHDCLSHLGIARELAAILNLEVQEPRLADLSQLKEGIEGREIEISDSASTPRYMNVAASIQTGKVTPLWLQARLIMSGLRPISPIVDITNYVMLETGNPTHAFAADKLPGTKMGVRFAKEGESLKLLDGNTVKLGDENLVITSNDIPVALAGVMGGASTHVEETTENLLLEVANFHPFTIQKTALKLNLRTEAAARFLKGIEADRVTLAASRLAALLEELMGAKINGVIDWYPAPTQSKEIEFPVEKIAKISGLEPSYEEVVSILKKLRFTVEETSSTSLTVTPPTDRLDIIGPHNVVGEVVRMVGLSKIPSTKIDEEATGVVLPHAIVVREALRSQLADAGFTETYNYSLEPAQMARIFGITSENHLELSNPPSPDFSLLRTSLIPGLALAMIKNKAEFLRASRKRERALFEIGHVYQAGDGKKVKGVIEEEHVAGMCLGDPTEVVKKILETMNAPALTIEDENNSSITFGKGKTISVNGKNIGYVGLVNQAAVKKMKYSGQSVGWFEISLDALTQELPQTETSVITLTEVRQQSTPATQFTELNKYPSVFRDISMLVDTTSSIEEIQGAIETAGGELVYDTELFDEYEPDDEGAGKGGKKSLSFHIEYASQERTLSGEEVDKAHEAIIEAVKKQFEADVR